MIDEKRIAEMSLTAKALRRDARDYREKLFAVGTDKTIDRAADDIDYLLDSIAKLQTAYNEINDFEQSQCAKLLAERGQLIDLAGNWKEAADQYHAERNELQAELAESQRREQAAKNDMKIIADAVREEYCDGTCCFACKFDGDFSITDSGNYANECPGFDKDDCFEWRGPQDNLS